MKSQNSSKEHNFELNLFRLLRRSISAKIDLASQNMNRGLDHDFWINTKKVMWKSILGAQQMIPEVGNDQFEL